MAHSKRNDAFDALSADQLRAIATRLGAARESIITSSLERPEVRDCRQVFVQQLSPETSLEDIASYFSQFGLVERIYLASGALSCCAAFVTFAESSSAENAIKCVQHNLGNRAVNVTQSVSGPSSASVPGACVTFREFCPSDPLSKSKIAQDAPPPADDSKQPIVPILPIKLPPHLRPQVKKSSRHGSGASTPQSQVASNDLANGMPSVLTPLRSDSAGSTSRGSGSPILKPMSSPLIAQSPLDSSSAPSPPTGSGASTPQKLSRQMKSQLNAQMRQQQALKQQQQHFRNQMAAQNQFFLQHKVHLSQQHAQFVYRHHLMFQRPQPRSANKSNAAEVPSEAEELALLEIDTAIRQCAEMKEMYTRHLTQLQDLRARATSSLAPEAEGESESSTADSLAAALAMDAATIALSDSDSLNMGSNMYPSFSPMSILPSASSSNSLFANANSQFSHSPFSSGVFAPVNKTRGLAASSEPVDLGSGAASPSYDMANSLDPAELYDSLKRLTVSGDSPAVLSGSETARPMHSPQRLSRSPLPGDDAEHGSASPPRVAIASSPAFSVTLQAFSPAKLAE